MAFFEELAEKVRPFTKSSTERLRSMHDALETVDREEIPGDVVECGVWRGGNVMLARLMSPKRNCWLYDTFDGMTEPDHELDVKRPHKDGTPGERAIDRYRAKIEGGTKWDAVELDKVKQTFLDMGVLDRTRWIVGDVEHTLVDRNRPGAVAVLRLDVDWYWPTRMCLEVLYPRLSAGGFLIVDDYGHWMGCKKAVDDFFRTLSTHTSQASPALRHVDYSCVVARKC